MTTPFDGKKWQLRFEPIGGHGPISNSSLHDHTMVATHLPHVTTSFSPLKQLTKFVVYNADSSPRVDYDQDTPSSIRTIWAEAHDVYYDPEFLAVRGDLHFDHSGNHGVAHSHHFIIAYRGKFGTGGTREELLVAVLPDNAAFEPTANLVGMSLKPVFLSHNGSWKADDVGG
ncbi:MAG: hypothetical protein AAF438_13060 [Pseudomonadota bacterium]